MQAERALLDWVPINSRLCTVRLDSSIRVNCNRWKRRCSFVESVYEPQNAGLQEWDPSRIISIIPESAAVVHGELDPQIPYVAGTELHIRDILSILAVHIEKKDLVKSSSSSLC